MTVGRLLCLLGLHRWGRAVHHVVTEDTYRYEQPCGREGCPARRTAPRRLWGPTYPWRRS